MNAPQLFEVASTNTVSPSMDSREIAELTGKEHRNVMRDIQDQLGQLEGGVLRFEHTYQNDQNGQEYKCYHLPKRETLILVSGYSVSLRARIIDRWAELEAQTTPTGSHLLALAVLEAQKVIEAKDKHIAKMEPKAKFYDAVTGSKDTHDLGTVAKTLNMGVGRNQLFELLRKHGVLMENNQPYQKFVDSGCFRLVEVSYQKPDSSVYVSFKTVVYQKGIELCRRVIERARAEAVKV